MKIKLKLEKHCIKTEAKKKYERLISQYFKKIKLKEDYNLLQLEKKIEGLKYFLENADFKYLRSTYPCLSGTQSINITIDIPSHITNK